MKGPIVCTAAAAKPPPLHTLHPLRRTAFNLMFAVVYTSAILALLYYHAQTLLHSTTLTSFSITFSMLISDLVLAFMWTTMQSIRIRPIRRKEFPQNLNKVLSETHFPGLDVFICTADPYKEPPMSVVNTALSVMAYDYPTEKISVYVSDDGGSELTFFALMEAAKFSGHWLPFCRKNNLVERSPEVYFRSNDHWCTETLNIKTMYESMKARVENVVERGKVGDEFINQECERQAFTKWSVRFTREDHPTVIQVLLDTSKDRDITDYFLPNLIYVSREKNRTSPHNFKGGALNVLIRVSATMTNAPIILTLDCDMNSNDSQTPRRALCYMCDPKTRHNLGWIQFPQRFHNLTKNDIYGYDYKRVCIIIPMGMDGLQGPFYAGTGGFFRRRAFFGSPSFFVSPEIPELNPDYVVERLIQSQLTLALAHHVASCNYEHQTKWGYKMGFKYGSIVEDCYTSYRLHCEGWRSIFCNPDRPAFLGDMPITLIDGLNQNKRWTTGLLEVGLSKYSPLTFAIWALGPLMAFAYSQLLFWAFWSIPLTIYAFLPQLALLHGVSIFPKVSEPWFFLYMFLVLGAYGQDFLEFVLGGGTMQQWWNDQRMWMLRGVSCYLFAFVDFSLNFLGISTPNFNVTNKVVDDEQSKRYEQGMFEFGVPSPMLVPIIMAAVINLFAFVRGLVQIFRGKIEEEGMCMQMVIAGFVMVNSWPVYEGMVLRRDKGKMPAKTSSVGMVLSLALYAAASLVFKN